MRKRRRRKRRREGGMRRKGESEEERKVSWREFYVQVDSHRQLPWVLDLAGG